MHLGNQLIDLIARNHNTLGLGILCLSACIEYLFPPFPGDTITVFGAFLVARRGWSGPAVFGAVTVGSAIGCMLDYAFGRWLGKTEERWAQRAPRPLSPADRFARRALLAPRRPVHRHQPLHPVACAGSSSSPPAWRGCAGGWCWRTARCPRSCGTRCFCSSASPSENRGIGSSPCSRPTAWCSGALVVIAVVALIARKLARRRGA